MIDAGSRTAMISQHSRAAVTAAVPSQRVNEAAESKISIAARSSRQEVKSTANIIGKLRSFRCASGDMCRLKLSTVRRQVVPVTLALIWRRQKRSTLSRRRRFVGFVYYAKTHKPL